MLGFKLKLGFNLANKYEKDYFIQKAILYFFIIIRMHNILPFKNRGNGEFVDLSRFSKGIYFLKTEDGVTKRLLYR